MTDREITLTVNGREYTRRAEPRLLLSDFLRHDLDGAEVRGQQCYRQAHSKADPMAHRASAQMPLAKAAQMLTADPNSVG